MRPKILKFRFVQIRQATKFRHANKAYRHVTGIDNLLVYSAKLKPYRSEFTLLNFCSPKPLIVRRLF